MTYFLRHFFLVATLSIIFSFVSKAQEIQSFGLENVGTKLFYIEDKKASFSLAEVQQMSDSAFKQGTQKILNFGNTSSAWWVKIKYISPPHFQVHLVIDAPNIEYINAYITDLGGKSVQFQTGSLVKKSPNWTIGSNFTLKLPVTQVVEQKTIYLRLKSNNILLAPVKLASSENIISTPPINEGIEYIYIGLLIGLLLFNLFVFVSIKDVTYLYYVLYVFTLSCYILLYLRGYSFIFGDNFRIFLNTYPHALMGLSLLTLLVFSSKFLHLETTAPWIKKMFYVIGCLGILLFFTSILGYKQVASTITQLLSFISALIIWVAGIIAFRKGIKPAKYFIIAWSLILVSTIIVTFSLGGIIVQNEFSVQLVPVTTIIELLLLSFALGDRYKEIMQAEKNLREENFILIKTQNQRLEESVKERTLQLSSTINELEVSNAVKNQLFSIIAHDLKSPLNSLMGILSLNDMQALTSDELRMLLAENKKTIGSINDTLNNLLHWAKDQMNGMVTQLDNFSLKLMLDELIPLYTPLIKMKAIRIQMNIEDEGMVVADRDQINLVIRNLIDNAIKFTPIGGKIDFTLLPIDATIFFSIENEIDSQTEIVMENLQGEKIVTSTYGTKNERGVGLGLLLCHEYINNNNSMLQIDLDGKVIKFSFSLHTSPI